MSKPISPGDVTVEGDDGLIGAVVGDFAKEYATSEERDLDGLNVDVDV